MLPCQQFKTLGRWPRNWLGVRRNLITRDPARTCSGKFGQDNQTSTVLNGPRHKVKQIANILFFLTQGWPILNGGNSVCSGKCCIAEESAHQNNVLLLYG